MPTSIDLKRRIIEMINGYGVAKETMLAGANGIGLSWRLPNEWTPGLANASEATGHEGGVDVLNVSNYTPDCNGPPGPWRTITTSLPPACLYYAQVYTYERVIESIEGGTTIATAADTSLKPTPPTSSDVTMMEASRAAPMFAASLVGEPDEVELYGLDLLDGRTTPACYRPASRPPRRRSSQTNSQPPCRSALHRRTASGHAPPPRLPPVRTSSTATAIDNASPVVALAPRQATFTYGTPAALENAPAHDTSGIANYFPSPDHGSEHSSVPTLPALTGSAGPIRPQARRGSFNLPRRHGRSRRGHRSRRRQHSTIEQAALLGDPSSSGSASRGRYTSLHRVPRGIQLRRCASAVVCAVRALAWLVFHPRAAVGHTGQSIAHAMRTLDHAFRDPRTNERTYRPAWLQAYIPFLIWLGVSLMSTLIAVTHHAAVFAALDQLAHALGEWGWKGNLAMALLISVTAIPPVPLYSTLVVLSGYAFGLWPGFFTAYVGALGGGLAVFLASRSWLRGPMQRLLAKSPGLQKIVRAIDKQPQLLFLIRLAPYPYNLLNTVLAASPTLTVRTYTLCTALALPKLLVHVGIGAMTKTFASPSNVDRTGPDSNTPPPTSSPPPGLGMQSSMVQGALRAKEVVGVGGVVLCVGIFFYLLSVARQAVDELDDHETSVDYHPLPNRGGLEAQQDPLSDWSDSDLSSSEEEGEIINSSDTEQVPSRNEHPSVPERRIGLGIQLTTDQTEMVEGEHRPTPPPTKRGDTPEPIAQPVEWTESPTSQELLRGNLHRRTPSRPVLQKPHLTDLLIDPAVRVSVGTPPPRRRTRDEGRTSISTSVASSPFPPSRGPSRTGSPRSSHSPSNSPFSPVHTHTPTHTTSASQHALHGLVYPQGTRLPSPLAQRTS